MAIEVIDGTIVAAVVKRAAAKTVLYDSITIRTTAGSERRLEKVAVAPDVAAALQPGTDGRFYGYKAIDHRGLFAMRTRDGRSAFAIPSGNERIMLMASIVGAVGFVVLCCWARASACSLWFWPGWGGSVISNTEAPRIEGTGALRRRFRLRPKLRLNLSSMRSMGRGTTRRVVGVKWLDLGVPKRRLGHGASTPPPGFAWSPPHRVRRQEDRFGSAVVLGDPVFDHRGEPSLSRPS